jgi:hypothetical protein
MGEGDKKSVRKDGQDMKVIVKAKELMSLETVVFLLIADAFVFLNIGGMIGFMICALFVAAKDEREGRQ